MFIVILTTTITSQTGLDALISKSRGVRGIMRLAADLNDTERIVRLMMDRNVLPRLDLIFRTCGYSYSLLNVYHTDFGIEHPMLPEPGGVAPTILSHMLLAKFLSSVYNNPY